MSYMYSMGQFAMHNTFTVIFIIPILEILQTDIIIIIIGYRDRNKVAKDQSFLAENALTTIM